MTIKTLVEIVKKGKPYTPNNLPRDMRETRDIRLTIPDSNGEKTEILTRLVWSNGSKLPQAFILPKENKLK